MKNKIISLCVALTIAGITFSFGATNVHADTVINANEINSQTSDNTTVLQTGGEESGDKYCSWSLTSDGVLHVEGDHVTADGGPFGMGVNTEYAPLVTVVSFDKVTKANSSTSNFFSNFPNLERIDHLENFDTSEVTDMSYMFSSLKKLTSLDLSKLNTENVQNMNYMFKSSMFENLDLSNWNVKNLSNVSMMFKDSKNLKSIDISGWEPDSLKSTAGLFTGVPNLTSVNMFKDFKGITNTSMMFWETSIKTIDASDWNLENTQNMAGMFYGMPNLESIDVSNWTLPKDGVHMEMMFADDPKLNKLDLSTWSSDNIYFDSGLSGTQLTQITLNKSFPLNNSALRAITDENGMPVENEEGSIQYEGYWIKVLSDNYSELIPSSEFITQENDGTYNYVNPESVVASATIKSNRGDQKVDNITVAGDDLISEFDVTVPDGKNADKETVKGRLVAKTDLSGKTDYIIEIVDPDGAGKVTYKNNNSSNNGSGSVSKPDVTLVNRLVSTHPNGGSVTLYRKNLDRVTDRALSHTSDWFSDQEMIKNGIKYYRVATNEWVKASDVYVYKNHSSIVNTDKVQPLTNSQGKEVTYRALDKNTTWKSDRLARINDTDYYRVATNEFVSAKDGTILED